MPSADRLFRCGICRRGFSSYSRPKGHMREHEGLRRCRNCGKQVKDDKYHRCEESIPR